MSAAQGTEGWFRDRIGSITGSRFGEVIATDKTGKKFLKSRETVITEVTLELITGQPGPMWTSKATEWGKAHEAIARMMYQARTGELCEQVGFIAHPRLMQIGCSPDGLIFGKKKGYESKCPLTTAVHLDTLLRGMPEEHMAQVQGGMFCTDSDEWDFVSYHPAFPPEMQLYIQTIKRDQAFIDDMQEKILSAIAEINLNVKTLLQKYRVEQ